MNYLPSFRTKSDPAARIQPLWNVTEMARFLGCSERHIYLLLRKGLPCLRVQRLLRFDPAEVREWLMRARSSEQTHLTSQPPSPSISQG